ncbi:caspase family protein [Streptomyces sp. NPDC094049]|uniref:caspase family protein n=1 Tax=Streptomyces sp. NPDC094049 TaxID=3154987 RepID=UPI00331ACEA3
MSTLPDPAASRAVLIGTSRYDSPSLGDLPAVAANLDALAGLLRAPSVWGLPAENCTVVANPATVAEVLEPIAAAAAEATDTLFVYYAGHGLVARTPPELHLALTASKQNASYTAVPYGLIREELVGVRALRQVVVLDCCYSGRALGRMTGNDSVTMVADEAETEGTYLIAAAAETKAAVSVPGELHTAFTAELLNVLSRGVPGKGPYVDLDTVYREVESALRAKQRPMPQRRIRNTANRVAFRNRAHPSVAEPTDDGPGAASVAVPRLRSKAAWAAGLCVLLGVGVLGAFQSGLFSGGGIALKALMPAGPDTVGTDKSTPTSTPTSTLTHTPETTPSPPPSTTPPPSAAASRTPEDKPPAPETVPCKAKDLQLFLSSKKNVYRTNEEPELNLTAKNQGSTPCTLNFRLTPVLIKITSASDTQVAANDCQTTRTDPSYERRIESKATATLTFRWNPDSRAIEPCSTPPSQRAPAGTYLAEAEFSGAPTVRTTFTLLDS